MNHLIYSDLHLAILTQLCCQLQMKKSDNLFLESQSGLVPLKFTEQGTKAILDTIINVSPYMCYTGGASGKELVCQSRRPKRCRFDPLVRKIPRKRAWQPTLVFLSGESQARRSLAGYSPQGHRELDTTEATQQQRLHDTLRNSIWVSRSLHSTCTEVTQAVEYHKLDSLFLNNQELVVSLIDMKSQTLALAYNYLSQLYKRLQSTQQ